MKRFLKLMAISLVSMLCITFAGSILNGCGDASSNKNRLTIPYNDFYWNNVKESFSYKEENRINIAYKNKDFDPDAPGSGPEYVIDDSLPSNRVIMITEQSVLEEALITVPVVDFEKEMVLVVLFSAVGNSGNSLEDIRIENDVLKIIMHYYYHGGSAQPYLVNCVIVMDKLDVNEVKLLEIKKS